jgi:hypothetical protein
MNPPAVVPPTGLSRGARAKRVAIWFVIFGLALAAAYGAGYWQPTQRIEAVERQLSAERARNQVIELRVVALEARRSLHTALLELGRQNYGLAQGRLALAAEQLRGPSANNPGLQALAASIAELKLDPAQPAQAHDAIVKLIADFDAAEPPEPPGQQP